MDQPKPLSYQSLKTVIQYMDSNFRIIRSCQIASLRNIQKVVPLRLGVLELNDCRLIFDNVLYCYQHCRKTYRRSFRRATLSFSDYDLNNDGNEEIFHDLVPGDIVIKDRDLRRFPNRGVTIDNVSYVICKIRTDLTKKSISRESRYGMKLRDIMRKKLHKALGGKRIHQVEHLKIRVYHGVLRLPKGLKLKIRKLSTVKNSMAVIDAILPILDVSSFPLKSLSIVLVNPKDPVIHSEILRTSELLKISNWGFHDNRWTNLVINLPNMKIHLKDQIPLNDIFLIIKNWMEHPRVIGTRLSMQAISVKEYLNEMEKEFKAVKRVLYKRKCASIFSCFTIPMTSASELNIYEAKSPNDKEDLGMRWEKLKRKQPSIVMEVMPIGTSEPFNY